MFFNKKEAVDIREIPRKNKGTTFVAKDGYGFVDLTKKKGLPLRAVQTSQPTETKTPERSMGNMFGFFDSNVNSSPTSSSSSSTPSSDTDEALRKVSMQLSDLDSKLYKLEQRIELLERKAGITNTSSNNSFGW
jgi:hypothetical protein